MSTFAVGQQVEWRYQPPHSFGWPHALRYTPYGHPARIISIGKRTARIEMRRLDGKIVRRFVKLEKLR
jgi:hypothetical protein